MYLDANIAYNYAEIKENRNILNLFKGSRTLIPLQCCRCKTNYQKKRIGVVDAIGKNISKNYCSYHCAVKTIRPTKLADVECICPLCDKIFVLTGKDHNLRMTRQSKIFCSKSCGSKYYNANNQPDKFMRSVSKLEKWLSKKLTEKYPNVEILYNDRKTCDGLELDIYLPSINLAFELNGIFHYAPIFGQKRLDRQIENDERKKLICDGKSIQLISIDTSKSGGFSPSRTQEYFDKICEIVDKNE